MFVRSSYFPLPDRQVPEMPHPEAVPHEDHGLLYAHSIVPEPLVLGHEGPRVGSARKHVGGFFIGVGRGYGFRDPGCGVVPMHIIPPFPRIAARLSPEPQTLTLTKCSWSFRSLCYGRANRGDATGERQRSMSRGIQPWGSSVLEAYECAPFARCAYRCFPLCSYCCMTGDRADRLCRRCQRNGVVAVCEEREAKLHEEGPRARGRGAQDHRD